MSDFGWGHLLGMGRTWKKKTSLPCLTTPFVTSLSPPLSLHSLSALSTSISLTLGCNLAPRSPDSLVGWSGWWMNVDDPYCEEVMELSAAPFLSGSFSLLAVSFHSSLPLSELRKARGRVFGARHISATSSYLLQLYFFLKWTCRVGEGGGRWQKELFEERRSCVEGTEMRRDY